MDGPVDHAATLAALLNSPVLIDALTAAIARRDDERRAEAAALAPTHEETTPEEAH
ncbi:hypothetical protein ABZY10_33950 [Streptomyces sp. NPDC006539]|uniref:hypothetical protein n=1 Tax=Streptomyces sp. NPDC006539 TaxID=3155352 RepID=UPI0033BCB8AD